MAADALILVDTDHAVLFGKCARNAAFHAQRVCAVAAGNRKADLIVPLNADAGVNGSVLQRLDHAGFSGVCKGAVIFAKMAAEAPFFINIYSFHGYAPFSAYSPACLMPRI